MSGGCLYSTKAPRILQTVRAAYNFQMTQETSAAQAPPTAAHQLERLKVIVKHLGDQWSHVLQKQLCMQALGRREDLHTALAITYASHVTNMLQDVLAIDLLREIGALVLDKDSNSASIGRAMSALRDAGVIAELRAEYECVRPLGHIGGDAIPPELGAQMDAHWEELERREQLDRFERWRSQLPGIETDLIASEVGEKLEVARNKGVAHYDVVREGDDWKLWRVDGTGLTWGQINAYVDTCTKAIEILSALVCQTSFDFEDSKRILQGYVDEFVEAVVIGLQVQKKRENERRQRLMKGFDENHDNED